MKTRVKSLLCLIMTFIILNSAIFAAPSLSPINLKNDASQNNDSDILTFDGTQSSWAEAELQEAYSLGLTYDQVEKEFQKPITREEFCVIAVKLYEKLGGAAPTLGSNPFTDTSNPEILKAYAIGIVNGTSANTFSPAQNVTRQEICVMILRALKACRPNLDTSIDGDFPFNDAAQIASWALDAMKFAYKNEIMKGTSATTISPLNNTSREQAIILLKRPYVKHTKDTETAGQSGIDDLYAAFAQSRFGNVADPSKKGIRPIIPPNATGGTTIIEVDDSGLMNSLIKDNSTLAGKLKFGSILGKTGSGGIIIKPGTVGSSISPTNPWGIPEDLRKKTTEEMLDWWYDQQQQGYVDYEPEGEPLKPSDIEKAGVAYLGKGYDAVTGLYADPSSVRQFYILDIKKLLKDGRVHESDISGTISRYTSGSSAAEYSKNLATHIGVSGGYMGFKASVDISFSKSSLTQTNRKFASVTYEAPMYELSFDHRDMDYRDYMSPSFKNDINDPLVSPYELFKLYGTHILRAVRMGGRLEYNSTTSSTYNRESSSMEMDMKAHFNALFASAGINMSTSQSQASSSYIENCEWTIKAYPIYGSGDLDPQAFQQWLKRLEKKPGFSEFGYMPLLPIWDLAANPIRRQQIKDGYIKYSSGQYFEPESVACINGIRLIPHTVGDFVPTVNVDYEYIDPRTNEKWQFVSNISPHAMLPENKIMGLYVRHGMTGDEKYPPVAAVFLVNESQGEDAKAIFEYFYGNDPSARLWGYDPSGKYQSMTYPEGSGLDQYINQIGYGDKLRLYYVTSTTRQPIAHMRVKHIHLGGQAFSYFPDEYFEGAAPKESFTFVSVRDLGSIMKGEDKKQDCCEGTAPFTSDMLPIHRNIFLEVAHFTY